MVVPTRKNTFWSVFIEYILAFLIASGIGLMVLYSILDPGYDYGNPWDFKQFLQDGAYYMLCWTVLWIAIGAYVLSAKNIQNSYVICLEGTVRRHRSYLKSWVQKLDFAKEHPSITEVYPISEYEQEIERYTASINNCLGELRMIKGSDYEVSER